MFWGLSPSVDLTDEFKRAGNAVPEELNLLLVGSVDSRHVLKTIAQRYRHSKTKLNFYIIEGCVESIGKQLLSLKIALQHSDILGPVQKVRFFMELYGNTLIRPSVAKYLTLMSTELIKAVTDYEYLKTSLPFVSMDIKYKERDYLENLLNFWGSQDEFNISECWDRKLRQILGARYDSKLGAFDWDLHMRLHSVGGSHVCNQEYRNFRLTGVAFSWLEFEPSKPNRSMVCGVTPNGHKLVHNGYLGDVQTGPFVTFGLHCEDEKFLKSSNGQNTYRATDISERNLAQIFHEIQNGEKYVHKSISDLQLGPTVMESGGVKVVDFKAACPTVGNNKCDKNIQIDDLNITISLISILDSTKFKIYYKKSFNIVYVGNAYVKCLEGDLIETIAAPNSLFLIENKKFLLNLRDKQLKEFEQYVEQLFARYCNTERLEFDLLKDDIARFIYK